MHDMALCSALIMLGLVQNHAVSVYGVLKCVSSVSFISKLPRSNVFGKWAEFFKWHVICYSEQDPITAAHPSTTTSGEDHYVVSHPLIPQNVENRFICDLTWHMLHKKCQDLWLHNTEPSNDLVVWPGYFFKLIFCPQNGFYSSRICFSAHKKGINICFFMCKCFCFARLQLNIHLRT